MKEREGEFNQTTVDKHMRFLEYIVDSDEEDLGLLYDHIKNEQNT